MLAKDVAPLHVLVGGGFGDRHADQRRAVRGDQVIQGAAGPLLSAGQGGDDLGRGTVEEIGAQRYCSPWAMATMQV
ncbi:hypothetical protein ACFWNG_18400 [Streptomyces sp. NPDC058391]|uniref:hypothetical protein n=1 Tax=Streptomyces sp. NPDC058391 TaxID=3346476 RepID=UPI00364B7B84